MRRLQVLVITKRAPRYNYLGNIILKVAVVVVVQASSCTRSRPWSQLLSVFDSFSCEFAIKQSCIVFTFVGAIIEGWLRHTIAS